MAFKGSGPKRGILSRPDNVPNPRHATLALAVCFRAPADAPLPSRPHDPVPPAGVRLVLPAMHRSTRGSAGLRFRSLLHPSPFVLPLCSSRTQLPTRLLFPHHFAYYSLIANIVETRLMTYWLFSPVTVGLPTGLVPLLLSFLI